MDHANVDTRMKTLVLDMYCVSLKRNVTGKVRYGQGFYDFVRRHPLGQRMKDYGFFDYAVNEALHLSEQEESLVISLMKMLRDEINARIDAYSEDVIEKAKGLLTQTSLTVSEIGFQLGFEFPQSFSRLFKSKTSMTPLSYRRSLA